MHRVSGVSRAVPGPASPQRASNYYPPTQNLRVLGVVDGCGGWIRTSGERQRPVTALGARGVRAEAGPVIATDSAAAGTGTLPVPAPQHCGRRADHDEQRPERNSECNLFPAAHLEPPMPGGCYRRPAESGLKPSHGLHRVGFRRPDQHPGTDAASDQPGAPVVLDERRSPAAGDPRCDDQNADRGPASSRNRTKSLFALCGHRSQRVTGNRCQAAEARTRTSDESERPQTPSLDPSLRSRLVAKVLVFVSRSGQPSTTPRTLGSGWWGGS
jgi:hypothetical protein